LKKLRKRIYGSPAKGEIGEKQTPTIMNRMGVVINGVSNSTYGPTPTHKKTLAIAEKEYERLVESLKGMTEVSIPQIEKALKTLGAPYIEGQDWPEE